MKKLQGLVQLR